MSLFEILFKWIDGVFTEDGSDAGAELDPDG